MRSPRGSPLTTSFFAEPAFASHVCLLGDSLHRGGFADASRFFSGTLNRQNALVSKSVFLLLSARMPIMLWKISDTISSLFCPPDGRSTACSSLPNVKDEPRRRPARLVHPYDSHSVVSFRNSFGSTRRDGRWRWLWRLVRRFELEEGRGLICVISGR